MRHPLWALPSDFDDEVGKILQFVLANEEIFDPPVFEAGIRKSKHPGREGQSGVGKRPLVRAVSAGQRLGLTQREIATILRVSERAVRNIERRAVKKLLAHPELRQVWRDYLSGQLEEGEAALTPQEVKALLGLVRTPEEKFVIQKVLRAIQA